MPDREKNKAAPEQRAPLEERLDSWKEIAAYLGRGVRTVQRWERKEGLPVHRLAHDKRGTIYARREELAAWWESRRVTLASQPVAGAAATPVAREHERVTWTTALTNWPALSSDARLIAYVSDAGQDGETPQILIQQIGGAALRLTNGELRVLASFVCAGRHPARVHRQRRLGSERLRGPDAWRRAPAAAARHQHRPHFTRRSLVRVRTSGCRRYPDRGSRRRWFSNGRRVDGQRALPDVVTGQSVRGRACPSRTSSGARLVGRADRRRLADQHWCGPAVSGIDGHVRRATGVAWVKGSLVFSVAGQGVHLYRQRISEATFQPVSAPERLTTGIETAWLPTAAAGHLAYFSGRADGNLWSVALDTTSGVASGPQRRMTRGTLPLGYLTLTRDCRTLAYFSYRLGPGDVFLRDLQTGSEKPLAQGPDGAKGYPAISPTGNLLAIGMRMSGAGRALRPISILDLREGTWRSLGEDCGGRPREWVDERVLIIERFARLNSIAIIDTETGEQFDLLQSSERSVSNPRLSPDRRWIAFDASRPGATGERVRVAVPSNSRLPSQRGSRWIVPRAIPSGLRTDGSCITRRSARTRRFAAPSGRGILRRPRDWRQANRSRCTGPLRC